LGVSQRDHDRQRHQHDVEQQQTASPPKVRTTAAGLASRLRNLVGAF
jgi:hypothetical protein